ncbi:MAG: PEP-CTERM sorting domain-containing protein [Verrucomicrobiota bacterium]|nr:PEP-CTERM sorting domain-containing protein [Verrucomicrobiota bacterium]
MKKLLLIAAIALTGAFTGTPPVSAQSASFTYTGVPANVTPGSSFTFDITLNFTSGALVNARALSYWLYQVSPASAPFPFAVTLRDATGSPFSMVSALTYPQNLAPITPGDFGGSSVNPLPSGSYFIAHITLSIAANAPAGLYTIGNTTAATPNVGGRISVIGDSAGNTAQIAPSNFSLRVVPEPGSVALIAMGALAGVGFCRRVLRRS